MAGFEDFIRQRMANTTRGYTTDPNGTPVMPPQVQPITTIPMSPTPMPMPTPMAGNANVGDGTGGASYRDPNEELAALISYLKAAGGIDSGLGPPPAMMPPTQPGGTIPGVDPGASINPSSQVYGRVYGPPPLTGVYGPGGLTSPKSGLDALIADAKAARQDGHYEDGSSDPSYRMSAPLGPAGPSNQDGVDRLIKETKWAQMYPGLSLGRKAAQMPSVSPAGAMAGVNPIPNPTIPHVPVNTYGPPQAPSNPQSGLDALIANAKQGGGQTSSAQRGPMNPIQQAAAVALMKMKGMK